MALVILDRDGVINEDSDAFVKSLAEWIPLPGSIEAIARLSRAGFTVAVATNQSGLGRGLFGQDDLDAMHQHLESLVVEAGGKLAGIYYCPHRPEEGCECRKPLPGLLDRLARDLGQPLQGAYMVGDSLRDLEAGLARGCRPVLVRTGKGTATEARLQASDSSLLASLAVYDDLSAWVDHLLADTNLDLP
ncbi:MAG TPA: D-glycero-beta-D-manno-heptose 1,7-bisphosphate 7-phosphatase [Porticoccaceae bacterium]